MSNPPIPTPCPVITLRIGVLPPRSDTDEDKQTGQPPPASMCHPLPCPIDKQQHLCVISPTEQPEGGGLSDLIAHLPHAVLELTHFTITRLSDAATCCHFCSFDNQYSFDSAIAAVLPLNTVLCVKGTAAPLDPRHGLSEAVYVSLELTLTSTHTAFNDTTVAPYGLVQLASTLPTLPLPAHIDDDSVQLNTAYRPPAQSVDTSLCGCTSDGQTGAGNSGVGGAVRVVRGGRRWW